MGGEAYRAEGIAHAKALSQNGKGKKERLTSSSEQVSHQGRRSRPRTSQSSLPLPHPFIISVSVLCGKYPTIGLCWWLNGQEFACDAGDVDLIPRLGRSPGKGNGNPLQYSCLENLMDSGTCWATVHGVAKSQTRLSE